MDVCSGSHGSHSDCTAYHWLQYGTRRAAEPGEEFADRINTQAASMRNTDRRIVDLMTGNVSIAIIFVGDGGKYVVGDKRLTGN